MNWTDTPYAPRARLEKTEAPKGHRVAATDGW